MAELAQGQHTVDWSLSPRQQILVVWLDGGAEPAPKEANVAWGAMQGSATRGGGGEVQRKSRIISSLLLIVELSRAHDPCRHATLTLPARSCALLAPKPWTYLPSQNNAYTNSLSRIYL